MQKAINRANFLGIALVAAMAVLIAILPSASSRIPEPISDSSFLEEWWRTGQGKGLFLSQETGDFAALGQLISERVNPLVWSEGQISELSHYVVAKGEQFRMSPMFVLSLIDVESGYMRGAISSQGAVGLMQLQPATAEMIAENSGINWHPGLLVDPKINIDLGLRYMQQLRSQFDYNDVHTLTAYNIGPHKLRARLNSGGNGKVQYVDKVMNTFNRYKKRAKLSHERKKEWSRPWL